MPVLLAGPAAEVPPQSIYRWITVPAPAARPLYPPLLDIAAAAGDLPGASHLLRVAAEAVAPRYEELVRPGLQRAEPRGPSWDDVVEQDGTAREDLLVRGLVEGLARHPEPLGLRLPRVDRWDHVSSAWLRQLLAHPDCAHHLIVVGVPDPSVPPAELAAFLAGATRSPAPKGPQPPPRRQPSASSHAAALALYDAWDPSGWGYLRRGLLVARAGDLRRIAAQHSLYFEGFRDIGRDFLYIHLTAYARALQRAGPDAVPAHAVAASVGAARLAPRARRAGGYRAAVRHYRRALRLCPQEWTERRIRILQELANVHAVQRRPDALSRARKWYARATLEVARLPADAETRVAAEIRQANGLALVEYHGGRNSDALALERRALDLAEQSADAFPRVAAWAIPLLKLNMARLLERRFADLAGASVLLDAVTRDSTSAETRARASLELGRLRFETGNLTGALDILEDVLSASNGLDAREEALARLLRLSAALRLERPDEAVPEAQWLARLLPALVPGVFDQTLCQLGIHRQEASRAAFGP
jgi:tetratricopeptide (TPR) repeat protein